MAHDFDLVRAAVASSWPAGAWRRLRRIGASAWRTSSSKTSFQSAARRLRTMELPAAIRIASTALAVAAAVQPLLRWLMPVTVRPAIPAYAYLSVAMMFAVAAWRPDAIAMAWPESRLRRSLHRWLGR